MSALEAVPQQMSLSLARKLLAVMGEVAYIQKDKKNEFYKYNYASESAIKQALHPALVKHGVLFMPVACDILSDIETVNNKGNKERLMTIRYSYRFVDAETGDFMEGYSIGTGVDASDKCVYKGITGAIKYILTSTFLIPTGDDPEREDDAPRGSKQAAASVAERKLAAVSNAATEARAEARATMTLPTDPKATPTTKNFSFLEVCQGFKQAIGEPFYYRILQQAGFDKSSHVLLDKDQQAVIKAFGAAKKMVDAAGHGEIGPKVTEGFWELFPEAARAAVFIQLRLKLNEACGGQDLGVEEYEAARKESKTQWELVERLKTKVEWFAKQSNGAA